MKLKIFKEITIFYSETITKNYLKNNFWCKQLIKVYFLNSTGDDEDLPTSKLKNDGLRDPESGYPKS